MVLFIIGCLSLGMFIIKSLIGLLRTFMKTNINIKQKYGQNCWAIVTGATDGIGKAYCQLLAQQNVNICMIVRNKEKAEKLQHDLQLKSKSQFRIIIADFKQSDQQGFFDEIEKATQDLDIGLLINNVGVSFSDQEFINTNDQELRDLIIVNCYPVLFLTKKLIPRLQQRKRSAIINVSSFSACMVVPYMTVYAATKAFVDFFSKSLNYENDNIDIMSHQPLLVSTPMTNFIKEKGAISPEECALGGLQRLGIDAGSPGFWKHRLQGYLLLCIPETIRDQFVKWEQKKNL